MIAVLVIDGPTGGVILDIVWHESVRESRIRTDDVHVDAAWDLRSMPERRRHSYGVFPMPIDSSRGWAMVGRSASFTEVCASTVSANPAQRGLMRSPHALAPDAGLPVP